MGLRSRIFECHHVRRQWFVFVFVITCAKYADFCAQKGSAILETRHSHLLIVNVNVFFEYTRI
jgi:hypothetical protein